MQTNIYIKSICLVVQSSPCVGATVYVRRNTGNFVNKKIRMC